MAPMTRHQSTGHKGPVLRPRCTGTERAGTHLLLSTLKRFKSKCLWPKTHKHTHT